MKVLPRLYAIADASFGDPVQFAEAVFKGGARLVQVRNKAGSSRELQSQVDHIIKIAPHDACVVVNDRVDVALISGAAGVHLGQTDLPVKCARKILGASSFIGISAHGLEQALRAEKEPADYVAVGPIFATQSKTNPDPVVGLDVLRAICSRINKPIVAIGGITLERATEVFDCGAASVAIISDLSTAANVTDRTRDWLRYN